MAKRTGTGTAISKGLRLKAVEQLYLKGYGPTQIHSNVGDKFGVSLGTIQNDVVEVRKAWKDKLEQVEGYGNYAEEFIERARGMVRAALTKDDVATAYRIEKDIASLLGVDFVTPIVRVGDRPVADVPVDEVDDELVRLDALLDGEG